MTDRVPIRVLVVDDEASIRVSLGSYLEDRDFDVFLAESAEESLDLLKRESLDLIVVDIRLPEMDGNTLILQVHHIQPAVQFLIHTGSTNYQVPASLAEIGIRTEDVFVKPVPDMNTIADAIRRHVCEEGRRDDA